MKNTLFPPTIILCLSLLLISCSAEDTSEQEAENLKAANLVVYVSADLVGIWDLHSMHSNVAVDFNGNGTSSKDILSETDCFDTMYYEFKSTDTVTASQAKLHINTTGITSCKNGIYYSPYKIEGDLLTVSFHDKNGKLITTKKQIELSEDKQFLYFNLSRFETMGYINDDSGNSTAVIDSIATVYKRR